METRCIMAVAEKMEAIKLQVVHQMLLILALELKAISIRCGAIFKSSILTINLSMWIELGFSGGTMKRGEITRFLGDLLVTDRLCKRGKYYASEVSIDYGTSDVKRVDFMQFEPSGVTAISAIEKGIFTCYEIKSCKEDVFSGNGLNFLGEKNYIVTTMDCYKNIQEDLRNGKLAKHIRECSPNSSLYYGIMVAIPEYRDPADEYENPTPLDTNTGWKLEIIIPCRQGERKRSITEMLFYMLRSGH